jgi:hypothetical protein
MQALRSSIVSRRHFAWLMWLALLLPIAQVAASWHVLSHTAASASESTDEKSAPHQTHCDLCVVAAAVSGGALTAHSPSIPPVALHGELPLASIVVVRVATAIRAYRSRAPPIAPV